MKRASRTRALSWVAGCYLTALAASLGTGLLGLGPLATAGAGYAIATLVVFGFSRAFDNSSFYDAYWSVGPPALAVYWLVEAPSVSLRGWCALGVLAVWGARLTWSWARGWTGLDHEDWRYVKMRNDVGRLYWLVSLAGIHAFPSALTFAGALSAYGAIGASAPFGALDGVGVAVALAAVVIEGVADRQLAVFREGPRPPGATIDAGLWRYSRHPNYFGEALFWWGLWLLAWPSDWRVIALAGPTAITLLFLLVSIPLAERRMMKRDDYPAYRRRVPSPLVPWFRRPG